MIREWTGIWLKAYKGYFQFQPMPPAPYFRVEFTAPKTYCQAIVHLCGVGLHELFINGQKVGKRWYTPALSQYDKHVSYLDYDVAKLLHPGKQNALIVHLGSGFYNCHNNWKYNVNLASWRSTPRMICDVEIDGTIVEASGMHWKVHSGPVVYDCHHEGEDYDARLELPEAFLPGFDDRDWLTPARAFSPGGVIELENNDPCRLLRRIESVQKRALPDNRFIYDMGTTLAGVAELSVQGPRDSKVTIRYGEMLDEHGRVDTHNVDQDMPRFDTDSYTLKGEGTEIWHPVFVWHGFRYVELTCSSPDIQIFSVTGLFIGSDFASTGKVSTSHAILNRVQELNLNSYRCNFMGIPTDCPTREKFGWLGDAALAMETGFWNWNPRLGLERLLNICLDTQRPDGNVSTHGPTTLWGMEEICPTYLLFFQEFCRCCRDFLDDLAPIVKYYDAFRLSVAFLEQFSKDDHLFHFGYADWCHPGPANAQDSSLNQKGIDPTMVETCALVRIFDLMAEFATYLKKPEDARHYQNMASLSRQAIHKDFYNAETQQYDGGFWTSNAMAIAFNVVPESLRSAVLSNLVQRIRAKKHQVWAGIQGAKWIPRALAENGYADDAFQMFVQPEFPGWGNLVARGATALWETWTGGSSRNHIMFGDVSAWMYRYLAGISPTAPGCKKVSLKPCFVPAIDHVQAEHDTPNGTIKVHWFRQPDGIHCKFHIPAEMTADIYLPGKPVASNLTGIQEFIL